MSSRGSKAWLLQRVTGTLLFITLGAHFFIYHFFMGPGMWGFDSIGYGANLMTLAASDPEMHRFYALGALFANPLWKVFDVTFITLGVYHGFYGIRSIIDDWVTRDGWRFVTNWIVNIVAVVLWVTGVVAVVSFNPQLF